MKTPFSKHKGFSLLEAIVIFVISGLLIAVVINIYVQVLKTTNRQNRVIQVDRQLLFVHRSLTQALTSLPGRGLATTNGLTSGTPILPVAGSIQNPAGGLSPIKLGIVTPYKINGQDAFTVAYADVKIPRLPVSEPTKVEGTIGRAKVSFIATQSNFIITKGTPTTSSASSSLAGDIKGTPTPTPSPSPSASPVPSPSPSSTGDPNPSSTPNAVPPNVPYNETLLSLPWKATPEMFKVGDVMLLINTPIPPKDATQNQQVQTSSRIVKLLSIVGTNDSKGDLQSIDFTYDLCTSGECGAQFPGLTNAPDAETRFSAGAVLVPLRLATFYYKSDQMSNRLVRNDGGVVLPSGEGNFRIQGGVEDIVGEADAVTVTYRLRDGSIQPTPNTPTVPWLSFVTSVDIELFREIPTLQRDDVISRKIKANFPIAIRNLD